MSSSFFGLEPTTDPHRRTMPVAERLCSGMQRLFGGCGLGAAIEVLEEVTDRPVAWATAQYLSHASPPSTMELEVTVPVTGRSVSQARAVGRVGEVEVLTVNAALGSRDLPHRGQFEAMPEMPPPDDCPQRLPRLPVEGETIMDHVDLRLARARPFGDLDGTPDPDGRSALWARMADIPGTTAAKLAILGDYVPFGTSQALGQPVGGSSLDNTLRVVQLVPTEWVLLDIQMHAVERGFGHGLVHLWAQDGTLLATASQSIIARAWS